MLPSKWQTNGSICVVWSCLYGRRNKRAISLYEEFGFEVEGTMRDYVFRDGEFVDALLMARMRR